MRRRLMLTMVGLVAVVLVIAGAGSLLLTRNGARQQAQQQLVSEANSLSSSKIGSESLRVLSIVRSTLKLEDADVIQIDRLGAAVTPLPENLTAQDIDVAAVQSGKTTSGRKGGTVYAVAPVTLSAQERTRLQIRAGRHTAFQGTFAVLLTRDVGDLGPGWGYFIFAGGAALVVAALVAWQISRRMARPLVEAMEATGRIASGELGGRVPVRRGEYPEFASLAGSINDMALRLQEGRARERHLLLSVSHDLRTPLTSIRGFAEAIQDGAIDDSAHAADVIIAESRRLERLVGDLLDLTKLEARQMSIALRPTDVAEVVAATAEAFRPAASANGLALVMRIQPEPEPEPSVTASPSSSSSSSPPPPPSAQAPGPRAVADPDRLAQLLANLLENAMTFACTTVTVGLVGDQSSGGCVITVDNDGPGIAPGDLHRVFERFYRADRAPNRKVGSGLGLAIVAELAAAMGGAVRAESPLCDGGGSRFVLTLRWWEDKTSLPSQTSEGRPVRMPDRAGSAS